MSYIFFGGRMPSYQGEAAHPLVPTVVLAGKIRRRGRLDSTTWPAEGTAPQEVREIAIADASLWHVAEPCGTGPCAGMETVHWAFQAHLCSSLVRTASATPEATGGLAVTALFCSTS